MPRYRVYDEVTYARVWYVDAKDENAALDYVTNESPTPDEEDQIDNQPYAVDLAEEEED